MIRSLDTIAARSVLVSLIGITLVHLLSLWTYERALDRELTIAHETRLAERLIAIKRSVMLVTASRREVVAHELSGGPIEAHWSAAKGAIAGGPGVEQWLGLAAQIAALAPDLQLADVVIGTSAGADPHLALVSMRLSDDSWINFSLFAAGPPRASGHGTLLSTSLMAFGVILLSALIARWLSRPIRTVADAVGRLSPGMAPALVPETGPREVRELSSAFNGMQRRIADLIERRTHSLAAVSHDLRTPLTRLKLRVEDLPDATLAAAMTRDIGDMEQMIDATLSYLRGDTSEEPIRSIDLVALLDTIVDDARDAGHDCALKGPQHLVINSRPAGLKRAFANLIGNAVSYGGKVLVTLATVDGAVAVTFEDDGPGIPEECLRAVFEPFVRLETSRNRETGGVGLGLTIAKANIEAVGGTIALANRPTGGLRVQVTLPGEPN